MNITIMPGWYYFLVAMGSRNGKNNIHGFEAGFTMALGNPDELLSKKMGQDN